MTPTLNQDKLAHQIIEIVCREVGKSIEDVKSKTRKREWVEARQLAMTIISENTKISLKTIGNYFSGRDHSTVIHAKKTIADLCDTDKRIRQLYDNISMEVAFLLPHFELVKYTSSEISGVIETLEMALKNMKKIKQGIDKRLEKEATNDNL